jgi:hypothetical protein
MNALKLSIKRRGAIAAAVVLLSLSAGAQAQIGNIGLRLGYNTASMTAVYSSFGNHISWSGTTSFSGAAGFHVGVSTDIPISEMDIAGDIYKFGICPNAMFTSKNVSKRVSERGTFHTGKYDINAYWLDVPVPFTFKKDFGNYQARVELGPYVAVGLFGSKHLLVNGAGWDYTEPTFGGNAGDEVSRFDFGVFYGVTLEFNDRYFIGVRYGSGLSDQGTGSAYLTLGYNIQM